MKQILLFLTMLYLALFAGGWWVYSGNMHVLGTTKNSLATTEVTLAQKEKELVSLKSENAALAKKLSEARAYTTFLSLALCPTLEAGKDALCIKDGAEWLTQTIQAGTTLPDPSTKEEVEKLLVSLSGKKPTAKQFYELLKPIEVRALEALKKDLSD